MAERSVERLRSPAREPTIAELRERVSDRFRSVGATAGALQSRVRAATDWRRVARRHPVWLLGTVAGAGVFAAAVVRRSRHRHAEHKIEAALGWLARFPFGPREQPRALLSVGAPVFKGAFSLLASMVVRHFSRRLRDELLRSQDRPRPRLVSARSGPA